MSAREKTAAFETFNAGRVSEALEMFREQARLGDLSSRCWAAHCLATLGRRAEAARELREILRLDPSHEQAALGLASVLRSESAVDACRVLGRAARRSAPARRALIELLVDRSRVQFEAGRTALALRLSRQALSLDPESARARAAFEAAAQQVERRRNAKAPPKALAPEPLEAPEASKTERSGPPAGAAALEGRLRCLANRDPGAPALREAYRDAALREVSQALSAGRWQAALSLLGRVFSLVPDSVSSAVGVGDMLRGEARGWPVAKRAAAAAGLARLGSSLPAPVQAQVREVALTVARGWVDELQRTLRWSEAARIARGVLPAFEGKAPELSIALAECFLQQGRRGACVRAAREIARRPPPGELRLRALVLAERWREACAAAEALASGGAVAARETLAWPWGAVYPDLGAARAVFPKLADALAASARGDGPWAEFWRASVLRRCGRAEAAMVAVPRFAAGPAEASLRRRELWLAVEVGRTQAGAHRWELAEAWFRAALRAPAPDWRAHAFRGEALEQLGRAGAAGASFRRAVAAAPRKARGDALAWRGEHLLRRGLLPQARRVLKEAAGLGAPYAQAWLGVVELGLGRTSAALELFGRALEFKPWDLDALFWRGEALRRLGRHEEALRDLDRARKLVRNPWVSAHRALVLDSLGRPQDVRAELDALAARVPSFADLPDPARARAALLRFIRRPHWDCRCVDPDWSSE